MNEQRHRETEVCSNCADTVVLEKIWSSLYVHNGALVCVCVCVNNINVARSSEIVMK